MTRRALPAPPTRDEFLLFDVELTNLQPYRSLNGGTGNPLASGSRLQRVYFNVDIQYPLQHF